MSFNTRRVCLTLGVSALLACSGGAGMAHTQVGGPSPDSEQSPETAPSASTAIKTADAPAPSATATPSASAAAATGTTASASATAAAVVPVAVPPALRVLSGTVTAKPASAAAYSVVFLEDGPPDPTRGMKATVDQKDMRFIPGTTIVAVGGVVTFLNSDPFPHNVFTPDGEGFNLGVINQSGSASRTFPTRGAYTLLCNIHPGMIGYVVVVPTGYFAKADKSGAYAIKDVPEGTYRVSVWASNLSAPTQSVTLKGGDATATFALNK